MESAYEGGAVGGKVCGGGGGGFLLFYIPDDGKRNAVFSALNLREVVVDYGASESKVVYEG